MLPEDIFDAVKHAGIQSSQRYTGHRNKKANAIVITARHSLTLEKLLKVKDVK